MSVVDILAEERVSVLRGTDGVVRSKAQALERLATMLATGQDRVSAEHILVSLREREQLQSTGVGGGVAVPHASVPEIDRQVGALLICADPVPFDTIDGLPVSILFALVGPKGAPAQHLKILARVSRLLRVSDFRERLVRAADGREAYELVRERDRSTP